MTGSRSSNHADEAMSESSQNRQSEPIREVTPRPEQATHKVMENFMIKMTKLLEASMATKRDERVPATGVDEALEGFLKFRPPEFYGEVEQEIKVELILEQLNDIYDTFKYEDTMRALDPLPPIGFAAAVEAAIRTKKADQAVIQRKAATGSAATPYKCPGQGLWKPRDPKRPYGKLRTGNGGRQTLTPGRVHKCPEMQQELPKMSKRTGRPPVMRGATEEGNNKPQVKAKVYTLNGLPVYTKAEVVETCNDWWMGIFAGLKCLRPDSVRAAGQVAFRFIKTYENPIPTKVTILVMIMCSEASEDCTVCG
ncbi:hypothetical protein M9H77_03587 [Catharanthus roseus]|uniref:Uncharacterized protein n=1 Tax=Catharanthus roseus TaxID=4058 RepID=A0ACC0CBU9_CATRO|nr:hypothetical protein M9H77_03587 [Catharanthus roseus]